jgi:predicted dehydrogenase
MPFKMNTHKIALAGCGRWGRNILRDLLTLGCEVSVADPCENARDHALSAGAAATASDLDELSGDFEGFIVAATTVHHAETVAKALARPGKVFCEKPLTSDVAAARQLALSGANRLFVMEKWRYHPGIEYLRKLTLSKTYGAICSIRTRRRQWGVPHKDVDPAWILAPHDLSIVSEIFGVLPELSWASGVAKNGWVEEFDACLGDGSAMISISALSPDTERLVSVTFDEAVVRLHESGADHLQVFRRCFATEAEVLPIATDPPLKRELSAFLSHLRGGPAPKATAMQAVEAVERLAQIRHRVMEQS